MIKCFAALQAKSTLSKFEYEPKTVFENDVLVKITHCGICHSDIHLIDDDWGVSKYPLVPGHEIIGTVEGFGVGVSHLKIGQRVGIGWQRGACLVCDSCINGDENLCAFSQATCVGHYGGYAEKIIVDGRFAFPIPDGLSSAGAAPLLCGGVTTYSPLKIFGVLPGMHVGVIGIGGLGHMAVKFARAMGCEVTAFSSSQDKSQEASEMGAHHFAVSTGNLDALKGKLDFILSTVNVDMDWNNYIQLLRADGKLCFVGVPKSSLSIPVGLLLQGRKSICASPIGSRSMITDMLHFANLHKIEAQVEVMPFSRVNEAIEKMRGNRARYRMVLEL